MHSAGLPVQKLRHPKEGPRPMRGAPLALGRLYSVSAAATLFLAACGGGAAQPTAHRQRRRLRHTDRPPHPARVQRCRGQPGRRAPAASPATRGARCQARRLARRFPVSRPPPSAAPAVRPANSRAHQDRFELPRTGSKGPDRHHIVNSFKMAREVRARRAVRPSLLDLDDATAAKGA